MELRLLSTRGEREIFEERLNQARALKGRGFREKASSLLGRVHLAFSDLYGVYDENSSEPDQMLAGFAMHNLAQFGPSCTRPDLSHLPPETVYEIGELWSVVKGNGLSLRSARALMTARVGCILIPGLKGARALLIYAISRRWDMTSIYPEFEASGPPLIAPYMETLDGRPVQIQPLVLQGATLRDVLSRRYALRFETNDDYSWLRLHNPFAVVHVDMRPAARIAAAKAGIEDFGLNGFARSLSRGLDADEPAVLNESYVSPVAAAHHADTLDEACAAR